MRTGILGGTFDPVHIGHLIIAGEVLETLKLDEIRFVPAAQPWMKKGREISAASHRLKMLELSLWQNARFVLDRSDLKRGGATYTVDTLRDMKKSLGEQTELFFILGADALKGFPQWKDPQEIVRLAVLVVVPRPGYKKMDALELEETAPGIKDRLVFLKGPRVGISALEVRKLVREGKSIEDLVTPGVAEYIREKGLYLQSAVGGRQPLLSP